MTSRDFAYWLQGLFELENPKTLNVKQTNLIKKHLALVFKHEIDPSMGDANIQNELNTIHNQGTGGARKMMYYIDVNCWIHHKNINN